LGAIKATHEENVIIADNALDFTRNCVKLLNDYALAKKIGDKSRDLIVKNYSWEMHVNELEKVYESVLKFKSAAGD
jgi:glycosyltransferase involved in cell wall biosynthesis